MMRLGWRLARSLGRPLHTGHVGFALVKNEVYSAPLKTEEKQTVLKKLNTLSVTELECYLSPKLSESIIAHREHRGLFNSVENLLDVGNIRVAQAEKVFQVLVKKEDNKYMGFAVKREVYSAPLKTEEKQTVLKKLNTLSATDLECYLSPKLSESIIAHRDQRGLFNSVENLLDVENIRKARAEKVFQVLLKDPDNIQYREFFEQAIVPEVDMAYYSKLGEPDITTLGISLDLNRVAYTKIDGTGKILHWDLCPVMDPTSLTSIISYQHQNIFKVASEALDSLPEADFYLLEEMKPILAKEQGLKTLAHLMRLRSAFLCLLMERREAGGAARVHTMKPGVVDCMFNLKIGYERKSIQDIMFNKPSVMEDQFVAGESCQISEKFPLSMSSDQLAWWRECDNLAREKLLTCLAQGLAFNHLCSCEARGQFD